MKERKLDKHIEFYPNLDFGEMEQVLFSGMIGLHTMEYEHFGIALVELMACGLIMIAHNSAGPAEDIIVENEEFGYLCNNEEQFMMSIVKIL